MNTYQRKTLLESVKFEGKGLHSGIPTTLFVHPTQKSGLKIIYGGKTFCVDPQNVTQTIRCTQLGPVSTVEHILSALAGCEITDAVLEFTNPEAPAMDGSAKIFFDALSKIGFQVNEEKELFFEFAPFVIEKGDAKIEIKPGNGNLTCIYDLGERWPGKQEESIQFSMEEYGLQIAPARTFGLEEELPMIRAAGLAQGLDETSAVILGKEGYLNAVRFENEPTRHKLLDLVGDIYLAGIPIKYLDIIAYKSGHTLHVEAAKKLKSLF